MGRNAKFYKKSKPRAKRQPDSKDIYDDADDFSDAGVPAKEASRPAVKQQARSHTQRQLQEVRLAARKEALLAQRQALAGGQASSARAPMKSSSSPQSQQSVLMLGKPSSRIDGDEPAASAIAAPNPKLKSKLWKNLEAQRAAEGKGEIATPREAGIDYLSQWEWRRVGKGKGR